MRGIEFCVCLLCVSLPLFFCFSFSVLQLKGWDPVDCGTSKFDTLLEENKRSFMWTVYSSICIFNSDLFSEGLSKTPEGSISLTAPSPPLLWDLHPTTTQTKLLFLPQECSCESERLLSGLNMQNRSREGKPSLQCLGLTITKGGAGVWCTLDENTEWCHGNLRVLTHVRQSRMVLKESPPPNPRPQW